MIVDDKPPLQGVYIAHFGVKGMKWGQRRKSSGSSDKSNGSKMSTGKKAAVGAAVIGGAAVAAIILSRRGRVPAVRVSKVSLKPSVMDKLREAQKMKVSNFNQMKPNFGKTMFFDTSGGGTGAWRPQTGSALARVGGARRTTNVDMGNIADVRRALNDPNHVWQL